MDTKNAYNQWAAIYDSNDNKTRDLDQLATKQTLAKYTFNHLLELGCGTGKNTAWLVQKATHVTSVDFSEKMLDIARQKVNTTNVSFIQADLLQPWQFITQPVDFITINLVFEHIKDLEHIFKKVKQNLQPNGLFFCCEFHPMKQYLGSKARFEDGGETIVLESFVHHFTDYLDAAKNANLEVLEIKEWFDEDQSDLPRLLSFVFRG